jgi:MoaA/NifB/PqqE/SkfB family radical SAM enzyme
MDAAETVTSLRKFLDPDITAKGERRASVPLMHLKTLWINTGTLCNIECVNCYIESSPTNDRLAYISTAEVIAYLDELSALDLKTSEIAFTGGEPFMNESYERALACYNSEAYQAAAKLRRAYAHSELLIVEGQ